MTVLDLENAFLIQQVHNHFKRTCFRYDYFVSYIGLSEVAVGHAGPVKQTVTT